MHPNPIQVVFGLHRDGIEWLVALHERLDSEWDPQLSRAQTIQMYNIIWYIQLFAFWYENHIISRLVLQYVFAKSIEVKSRTTSEW